MRTQDKNLTDLFNLFFNDSYKDLSGANYAATNTTLPAANIKETDKSFIIELAVPGKEKSDFNIELNNNILSISSEIKKEDEVKGEKYTRREYFYGEFKRSFTLPEDIVAEKISAEYTNGELIITIPKKEEKELKPKTIKVK